MPSGPAAGERNAAGDVLCVLRANRAAWISSFMTTSTPSPAASGLTATRSAAARLAGPSAPSWPALRIAPVTTTGACAVTRQSSA